MPQVLITLTGDKTYNFHQKVAEPHRILMEEETLDTSTKRFELVQSRNTPVRNGESLGKQKSMSKLTVGTTAPNVSDSATSHEDIIIVNIDGSVPLGAAAADVADARDVIVQYVQSDAFLNLLTDGDLANA